MTNAVSLSRNSELGDVYELSLTRCARGTELLEVKCIRRNTERISLTPVPFPEATGQAKGTEALRNKRNKGRIRSIKLKA